MKIKLHNSHADKLHSWSNGTETYYLNDNGDIGIEFFKNEEDRRDGLPAGLEEFSNGEFLV